MAAVRWVGRACPLGPCGGGRGGPWVQGLRREAGVRWVLAVEGGIGVGGVSREGRCVGGGCRRRPHSLRSNHQVVSSSLHSCGGGDGRVLWRARCSSFGVQEAAAKAAVGSWEIGEAPIVALSSLWWMSWCCRHSQPQSTRWRRQQSELDCGGDCTGGVLESSVSGCSWWRRWRLLLPAWCSGGEGLTAPPVPPVGRDHLCEAITSASRQRLVAGAMRGWEVMDGM